MIASTTEGQLRRCLAEVRFPANKQDPIDAAISNRCDDDTVAALRAISTMTYTNVTQVIASASIVEIGVATLMRCAACQPRRVMPKAQRTSQRNQEVKCE